MDSKSLMGMLRTMKEYCKKTSCGNCIMKDYCKDFLQESPDKWELEKVDGGGKYIKVGDMLIDMRAEAVNQ